MGELIGQLVDISWKYVLKEKSEDMIHVLQFPYNGEPPRVSNHEQMLSQKLIGVQKRLVEARALRSSTYSC